MTAPVAGRVLAGRYRLGEPVDAGGTLWRGHDEALGLPVDIRRLDRDPTGADGGSHAQREVRITAARRAQNLFLPGIASVVDVVEEDEDAYIVTEAVPGRTLADVVDEIGPLTEASAAQLGVHVLDALEPLHAVGLAHGDLRPQTVRITRGQAVVLTGDAVRPAVSGTLTESPAIADVLTAALPDDVSPTFTNTLTRLRQGRVTAAEARSALLALTLDHADPEPAPPTTTRRHRRHAVFAAAAAVALVAGAVALIGERDERTSVPVADGPPPTAADRDDVAAADPDDVAAGNPRVGGAEDGLRDAAPVPAGWSTYQDPNGRYALGYPPGWEREPDKRGARFVSGTGLSSLLVVNRTGTGTARDQVVAAGQAFAKTKRDYEQVRLEETTFRGVPAHELEATFTEDGVRQRASALSFVVDGRSYLVLLQSHDRTWDQLTQVQRDFRASFRAPG